MWGLVRSSARTILALLGVIAAVATAHPATTHERQLKERFAFWEAEARLCSAGEFSFPTKDHEISPELCGDGDMTMFNGLLCFSGEAKGCKAVIDAQDPTTGQWFRSPRIRLLGSNDRGDASFSPDMSLGVQLYLVTTGDVARAEKWANWLDRLTPCAIERPWPWKHGCWVWGVPTFCTEVAGCIMRPGDAASLASTFDYLHENKGMASLRDGSRLRGYLSSWKNWGDFLADWSASLNKPGYSQHLVAVEVVLHRKTSGDNENIRSIANRLAKKTENTGNAFFAYIAGAGRDEIIAQTLERCPSPGNLPTPPLIQWQWERDNSSKAWLQSSYWDCIFMGRLLGL